MFDTKTSTLALAAAIVAIVPACDATRRLATPSDPRAPVGGDASAPDDPNLPQDGGGGPGPVAGPGIPVPPVPVEPQWFHPTSLADTQSMDGNDSDSGSVAAGSNGDAILAVEYGSRLFLSEKTAGVWNHPVRYVTQPHNPAGGSMFTPRSALRPNGDAVVVWAQRDNGIDRIYAARRTGGVWTDPANHADHLSPAGSSAQQPRVVIDPSGDAIVSWEQYVAGNGRIFKSELHNGTWTNPTSDNDGISAGTTHAQDVVMAVGPDGHVIIAWSQWGTSNYSIFLSERIGGVWTHPSSLAAGISPAGTHAFTPKVAFDGASDAIVTWVQSDGITEQVFKSEYRAGVWQHPTGLTDNISPDGTAAHDVQVAMSANREAVIVWSQDVAVGQTSLFKSEYRAFAWTHPSGLGAAFGVGQDVNEIAVAMDTTGNTVVLFTAGNIGQNWATYLSEYRYGGWRHPATLADKISPGATSATLPYIAVDGSDVVTAIWRQSNGMFQSVYISEYR